MKVVLAIPPARRRLLTDSALMAAMPHVGLCHIAGALKAAGHEVTMLESPVLRLSKADFLQRLEHADAQALLLTATTVQITSAGYIAAEAKRRHPSLLTVVGGPHASALPVRTLREFPGLDVAVTGEGEHTAVDLLAAFAESGAAESVAGAYVRRGDQIVDGGGRDPIEDLDALPFPLFEGLPLDAYARFFTPEKVRKLPVHTSRGCPFRCHFCMRTLGDKARFRSVENVLDEVERDVRDLGARMIIFTDENFAFPIKRVLELCDGLRGRSFNVPWHCETHASTLTDETALAMKQAGCEKVSVGIESGDPEILAASGKKVTLERIRQAARAARKADLVIHGNFILGHPHETERTATATIDFARSLKLTSAGFAIMVPFPGSDVFRMARRGEGDYRLLSENWDHYGRLFGLSLELKNLPRYKLVQLQIRGYRQTVDGAHKLLKPGFVPDFWRTLVSFGLINLWSWYDRVRYWLLGPRKAVVYGEDAD